MTTVKLILIAWMCLNALIQFGKGCAGVTRTYTISDGVLGIFETVIAIWLVTTL